MTGTGIIGTLTIREKKYDLPGIDHLTFDELRLAKQLSGYGAQTLYPAALVAQEGDALIALAMIVIRRSGESITEADAGELTMADLDIDLDAMHGDDNEEKDADPTVAALADELKKRPDGSLTSSNGSPGSDPTPVTAGSPSSAPSSA